MSAPLSVPILQTSRPTPFAVLSLLRLPFFTKKELVTLGCPVPSWEEAWEKTYRRANAHVLTNRIPEIDAYVQELGIETETIAAAVSYAQWSAAAEYRLLAAKGIRANEISFEDREHLGKGSHACAGERLA